MEGEELVHTLQIVLIFPTSGHVLNVCWLVVISITIATSIPLESIPQNPGFEVVGLSMQVPREHSDVQYNSNQTHLHRRPQTTDNHFNARNISLEAIFCTRRLE